MKLLHIDSSILGQHSASRVVGNAIVASLSGDGKKAHIVYRDLAAEELPHLTLATLPSAHAAATPADQLDADQTEARKQSDAVLEEFLTADTVVIAAPMYNFTVPSQLKAWIDRILIGGVTFRYGPNGPEGLITNKRVIIAVARGGLYGSESPAASAEHAEQYLRAVFGFIGVAPELVIAEGLAISPESREKSMADAAATVSKLAA